MRVNFKKMVLVPAVVSLVALASAYAATDDPTEFGGNARLLGMGQAYSAISNDTNAIFLNPAGLGSSKSLELSGMYYQRIFGTYYYLTGAGVVPTSYGTFALGYVGSGTGRIVDTTDPSDLGEFGYSDNVLLLSYGSSMGRFEKALRRVFIGGNLKVFNRGYEGSVGDRGTGLNFDLGVKYFHTTWLYFGASKSNILPKSFGGGILWTSGYNEDIESVTRLGAAVKMFDGAQLIGLDMRVPSSSYRPVLFAIGTEYRMNEYLAMRAGLSENIDAQASSRLSWDPSLGVGFNYQNLEIDYAYKPYFSDQSNVSHFISLAYVGNAEDTVKIKTSKLDEETVKYSSIYEIPGKVYDDLGNVVRGADVFYPIEYWKTRANPNGMIIPVTAQIIDYDTLMAYAFTDIKAAKEEQSPKKYGPGDIVPILVEAPYDIDSILAIMPDGDQIKLLYDEKAAAWYGIWRVQKGMTSGLYRARIVATDFEGVKIFSESTPFFIEGVVAGIGTPETKVAAPPPPVVTPAAPVVKVAAPPLPEAKAEAQRPVEAQKPAEVLKPAEEKADLEAQRKAEEQAKLEAQKKAEEEARIKAEAEAKRQAELKAQKEAEEKARVEAQKAADEKARMEAQRKAEEQAKLEAQRKAEEAAKLEAQRKTEEAAKIEAQKDAEGAAKLKAQKEAEEAKINAEAEAKKLAELEARMRADEQARLETRKRAEEQAKLEAQRKAEVAKVPEGIGGPVESEIVGIQMMIPSDKTETYSEVIFVKGVAGKEIKKLTMNGKPVKIGGDRKFTGRIPLSLGKNLIVIEGEGADGAKAKISLRVLRLGISFKSTAEEINRIKMKSAEERAVMTIVFRALGRALRLGDNIMRSDSAKVFSNLKDLDAGIVKDKPFKDVGVNDPAAREINAVKIAGLLVGYPKNVFKPNAKITLAEFSAVILRSEGLAHPRPAGGGPYWATGVIAKAKELRMLKGIESMTINDFKNMIFFERAVDLFSGTKYAKEKANNLLDWESGY